MKQEIKNIDFRDYYYGTLPKGVIITDPPYNQGYHYNEYSDKLSEEEYIDLLSNLDQEDNGCVVIHYPEETINILPKAFKNKKCEQVVSWVYNSNTGKQHRTISWWGCKPDFSKVRQPYKNPEDKRIQQRIADGKEGAKLYDWWQIEQVKNVSEEKTIHPCQIPLEVMKRIILTTCEKDDLIIDPFCGSGTTMLACKDLGYNGLGFEINKDYFNVSLQRLSQQTLF